MNKRKKYLISCFLILVLLRILIVNTSYSDTGCNYQGKINKCISANLDWSYRAIEDFICVKSDNVKKGVLFDEKIAYQVILDEKFTEIDEDIDKYLDWLEKNKSFYFWKDAKVSYLEWIDTIEKKLWHFWEFWEKFKETCGVDIISETISCSEFNSVSIDESKGFFNNNGSDCMQLAETKLYIAKQVAFNILHLNKYAVRKDEHKSYVKKEKIKYEELIDSANVVNKWYMERVLKKWPSKTLNPH